MKHRMIFLVAALLMLIGNVSTAKAGETRDPFAVLGEIPVQHNGRVKPFASFADEALLYVAGKRTYQKIPAVQLVWEWIARPEKWNTLPMLKVRYGPLAEEFGVMLVDGKVTPQIVLEHRPFLEEVSAAKELQRTKETLTELQQKRTELYDKAAFFRAVGQGALPGFVPHPQNSGEGWFTLEDLMSPEGRLRTTAFYSAESIQDTLQALSDVFQQMRGEPHKPSYESALKLRDSIKALMESQNIFLDDAALEKEMTYNRLKPFHKAWQFYLVAALLGLISGIFVLFREKSAEKKDKILCGLNRTAMVSFLCGFFLHTYGFYLRCVIAGRPPVSNMYESVIWVSWAAALFALVLSIFCKADAIRTFAAFVSAIALVVAQGFPALLDPSITPLVPVLRSNLWLTVHVLTITMSYGAFALAWGLGHGAVISYVFFPQKREINRNLTLYLYRAIQIGVVLLAAGTVLGGVWANYSWGRFWGWDPKETWALIALLGYILILHGRFIGWLDPFGFSVGAVVAFLGVVMAWYGVNFVLAAGLHSYGFGGGGAAYVMSIAALDLAITGVLILIHKRNQQV
ncbi:MAG: cytochrome c biogenesis protein CcsA [Candidatus Omnitrophica bacterium]|nr:cytochrome c biogenesis protein CcsA [Candidatus Omnitrophota bacterium]